MVSAPHSLILILFYPVIVLAFTSRTLLWNGWLLRVASATSHWFPTALPHTWTQPHVSPTAPRWKHQICMRCPGPRLPSAKSKIITFHFYNVTTYLSQTVQNAIIRNIVCLHYSPSPTLYSHINQGECIGFGELWFKRLITVMHVNNIKE